MFYYLANKRPVDVDGAIEGMLDEEPAHRYFLDLEMGNVGCIDSATAEGKEALKNLAGEGKRYRQLPRVSEEMRVKWLREFIEMFVRQNDRVKGKNWCLKS